MITYTKQIMAAVAGVLLLCSSSAAAAVVMMGGDDKDKPIPPIVRAQEADPTPAAVSAPTPTPTPAPAPTPAPTPATIGEVEGFSKYDRFTTQGGEESCMPDMNLNGCAISCEYDPQCVSFTFNSETGECCVNSDVTGVRYNTNSATFLKNLTGYFNKKLGDRSGGKIEEISTDLDGCLQACDNSSECIGFSYGSGVCLTKKSSGLSSTYSSTGKQFYEREITTVRGRYVKIEQTITHDDSGYDQCERNRVINLAEMEVLDKNGVNMAIGKTVRGTAAHGAGPLGNLVDGKTNNFAHTNCPPDTDKNRLDYMEIDLGEAKDIQSVKIVNRGSEGVVAGRVKGCKVTILDASKNIVATTPVITDTKLNYYYNFGTSKNW